MFVDECLFGFLSYLCFYQNKQKLKWAFSIALSLYACTKYILQVQTQLIVNWNYGFSRRLRQKSQDQIGTTTLVVDIGTTALAVDCDKSRRTRATEVARPE